MLVSASSRLVSAIRPDAFEENESGRRVDKVVAEYAKQLSRHI